MDEDSAGENITDMEKLSKFSVSAALHQWLKANNASSFSKRFDKYLNLSKWSPLQVEKCLEEVAQLLLCDTSAASDSFVASFGPVLIEVLERASNSNMESRLKHPRMSVLLGKLGTKNKAVLQFIMHYFQNHPPPFQQPQNTAKPMRKRTKTDETLNVSDLELLVCCFNLLETDTDHFKNIWDWSAFISKFSSHQNCEVRWIVCQCLALLGGMSESDKLKLVKQTMSTDDNRKFTLKYYVKIHSSEEANHFITSSDTSSEICKEILSDSVVDVEGVLLPRFSKDHGETELLVPVTSARGHLQNLALAITSSLPVLISGPVGCGKTTLVEHVAALTGRTIHNQGLLKVQLGDQTDAKVLLGTYHSTDVPGEFIWNAGVLTRAVREGRWLLLEDVDYAPMDVISMLMPVVESLTLNVPGHGDVIRAAPGFQLFATQRTLTGQGMSASAASAVLGKRWRRLAVEPLSRSELQTVIDVRYPQLSSLTEKLLDAYYLLLMDEKGFRLKINDRALSPRDLFKWCRRIAVEFQNSSSLTSTSSQLNVFQDALDCFVASLFDDDKQQRRLQLSEDVGARLNLLKAKAEFYCNSFKPTFNISDDTVSIGRISLDRCRTGLDNFIVPAACFSWTRSSSVLLERLAVCVRQLEPVLLVGETGTGKTSTVQYLSQLLGRRLTVINLNQQSDSADLLGGYKPIDLKWKIAPVRQEFESLFQKTFNIQENAKFLSHVAQCFANRRWADLIKLISHSQQSAVQRCIDQQTKTAWQQLGIKLQQLRQQIRHADSALAFAFVEGSLVKSLKQGHWVLLDEINLATAETLECLSGLLESDRGSLYLLERGDREPIQRHPNFRLFAAMNPATDVGKKQLPTGLRSRFTEFFVDEIAGHNDLATLIGDYLRELNLTSGQVDGIVRFYMDIRGESLRRLTDGTGRQPHYSLRTLCRALTVAASNPCCTVARSLYEAFCLSFLTQLDRSSHPIVEQLVVKNIIGRKNLKSVIGQPLPPPAKALWSGQSESINVEGYWIPRGELEPSEPEGYIMTDSVRRNLKDLTRVVSLGRLPVLLQGETSVGKTSLIRYLAQLTGNKCVRVNNHEHTDLQEYVGSYAADPLTGKLAFREGVLVQAMRTGRWLILDELNLAPSDVLEALNRLLDDNRELFIAETQETVRAHPRFLLFATQNPPGGTYAGRKMLSRAFRNRFVELHFDQIPADELQIILHKRCAMPPSYCQRLVAVMQELQLRRRGSAAFAGKQGFMTLRDLFRWAERYRLATGDSSGKYYDWDQHLADEGYLVLAGRVRKEDETLVIREVLEKQFKRTIDPQRLFTLNADTSPVTRPILESLHQQQLNSDDEFSHLVWTYAMRRLAVLVGQAVRFVEPVLLVGDTGCGKTSVCQYLAGRERQLMTINCHQYSEGSDFLGGLRPVRNHTAEGDDSAPAGGQSSERLFEWVDGPLVQAMTTGHYFLADEISLADDSVLERLNSVLEPERSLLLSEKESEVVKAVEGFRFLATMNPGGDYGKKELSPALRNRLTEIWCPGSRHRQDMIDIIDHNIVKKTRRSLDLSGLSTAVCMVDFIEWFAGSHRKATVSIRDILSWVQFINTVRLADTTSAYIHGACLVFLDSLGDRAAVEEAIRRLAAPLMDRVDIDSLMGRSGSCKAELIDCRFGVDPFYIEIGPLPPRQSSFTFQAPSTSANLVRLLRALQLKKPLLLEGSPGVGKTSLVTALAQAAGHQLVRINLSEQTDVSDLFGADLPVEGSETGGHFEWRDGPLLRALKEGQWIVLDELNLASQSVLEGLNAVLDHRGQLYIPELGRSFSVRPEATKLFACQNPLKQGGARKGLPRSFLNRFTQVHVDPLTKEDLEFVAGSVFPTVDSRVIANMVDFNEVLVKQCSSLRGGPWEFNLRDIFRWCQAVRQHQQQNHHNQHHSRGESRQEEPGRFVGLIYSDRMRTPADRQRLLDIYRAVFGSPYPLLTEGSRDVYVTESWFQVGSALLPRGDQFRSDGDLLILRRHLRPLESLMHCVRFNWMAILVGPRASGKTSLVKLAAQLAGRQLDILNTNSAMDTTELLGGFEQGDVNRTLEALAARVDALGRLTVRHLWLERSTSDPAARRLLEALEKFQKMAAEVATEPVDAERLVQQLSNILQLLADSATGMEPLLCELKSELEKVSRLVSQRDVASGCFEWTDSLLVKALREGRWLLIDNVNLCSPSVLDRLNGLLEPEGQLALSERGVVDGGVPCIRPHEQFRLFLAMDPRHGEISRAMRNRGVEIYLPTDDSNSQDCDDDLVSIVSSSGLVQPLLQQTLIQFHRWMVNQFPSAAPQVPSMTELVQAAWLAAQRKQMLTTAGPLSCLDETCAEVYIRPIRSPEDKEAARLKLAELIEAALTFSSLPYAAVAGPVPLATAFSSHQIALSSTLARVRQAGLSLIQSTTEEMRDSVLLFYLTSSIEDVRWRTEYLDKIMMTISSTDDGLGVQLQEVLLLQTQTNNNLPWDLRWFANLQQTHDHHRLGESELNNRISLAMFWTAWFDVQHSFSTVKGSGTLAALTQAIESGSLAEEAVPDRLLVSVPRFCRQMDEAVCQLLSSPQVQLTDADWANLMNAFFMRNHMRDLDLLPVGNCDGDLLDSSLGQVTLYWNWLLKRSIPIVRELLDRFSIAKLDSATGGSDRGSVDGVSARRLSRWLEPSAEPFADEKTSRSAQIVASVLPTLSHLGSKATRDFVRLLASEDNDTDDLIEQLTQLQREETKQLGSAEIFSLLDHLVLLQHCSTQKQNSGSLTLSVPTTSAAQLDLVGHGRPWAESLLAHWEVVNRLELIASPLLSRTAASILIDGLVTLAESEEKHGRLLTLQKILWLNADHLQLAAYDPLTNDHRLAVESLNHLILGMDHAQSKKISTNVKSKGIEIAQMAQSVSDNPDKLGSLWLLQGLARCLLLATLPGSRVDPVVKRKLKSQLKLHELERLERLLRLYRLHRRVLLAEPNELLDVAHPHIRHLAGVQQQLSVQSTEESKRKPTWRPESSLFDQLIRDLHHYVSSVASPVSVLALHEKLTSLKAMKSHRAASSVIAQAESWMNGQRAFYQSIKTKYMDYPDVIVPFLIGVAQMIHGVQLLALKVRRSSLSAPSEADDFVSDLFDRPSRLVANEPAGLLALAQLCTASTVGRLLDSIEPTINKATLLLSALKDIERYASLSHRLDRSTLDAQLDILDAIVSAWTTTEERKKQKKIEEESLYRSRTHQTEVSDEQAEKIAMAEYFPSYVEQFEDAFVTDEPMDTSEEAPASADSYFELSEDDMRIVSQSHVELLVRWTRSFSVAVSTTSPGREIPTPTGGFYLRYPMLGRITLAIEPAFGIQLDRRLVGAHLIYMDHLLNPEQSVGGRFDFYRDQCPGEAILCRPVLLQLKMRIAGLLEQWPGHAALQDITNLLNRLLGFGVDSPLMKLVTGLEMLLAKCHEWESNAHRGVSLASEIQSTSELILRWRTLELDGWKLCLDRVEEKAAASSTKYWFHLYSTVTSLLSCSQPDDWAGVQSTLRQFMESSNLGQFVARLKMLKAFVCHVAAARTPGHDHDKLLRLLWHSLLFYGQFESAVIQHIARLRQPIERKVRDFVKIMRWNDVNYYALKEAVHKAQSTLHRHMKEWSLVLEQSARNVLSEPGVELEIGDPAQSVPVDKFISVDRDLLTCPLVHRPILSRLPSLCTKARRLCGDALKASPFEKRIMAVDELVGTVVSSVTELQKLKVIEGADKERQKSEARSVSMRKRKSLFELFAGLRRMGISYRRGAFLFKPDTVLEPLDTILPVLELEAALQHLPQRSSNTALLQAWNKGPHYYSRCLARLAVSVKLLDKPSDELGPRVVERLKGSAAQFMVAVQDQWRACSWTLDHFVRLRTMLVQLSGPMCLQSGELVASSLETLRQLVIDALAVLQDFEALMKSCPSPSSDIQTGQVFQLSSNGLVISRETADNLRSMRSSLTQQLTSVRLDLDKQFNLYWTTSSNSSNWVFSTAQYDCIASGYSMLDSAQQLLSLMVSAAGDRYFGSGLNQLKQRFSVAVEQFQQKEQIMEVDTEKKEAAEEEVDKLCQSLLHGIQEIYKKYATASTQQPANDEDGDEDDFEVDHLTAKLIGQMQSDLVQLLKLETTTGELHRCLTASRHHGQLLTHCATVVDQYIHAVEYYFAQQLACLRASCKLLSVLLNLFNQLLSKGFCSPSELDESQDQGGEGQFQENESGGLGDGQGAKDVSDQIENEDQLDTARQQGQEEEEGQNKDGPKEEENGIEMSQDFDAQLQDREEKEEGDKEDGEESEDSEDDQELDKEMGETGQEADQLEEKLWGSDEEDEKEEEELEEDQGQGDGRQDESQITAKDGQDDDEQETGQDDKEKKKKRPKDTEQEDEDDDNVNDDQIDPYHQSNEPPPAPEPLDLPDDLNLDGDNPKDDEDENADGAEEKDPFDIDAQLKDSEEAKEDEEQKEEGEDESDKKQDEEEAVNPTEEEDKPDEEKGIEDGPKDFEMEEMPPADKSEPEQPLSEPEKAVPSTDQPSKSEAQPATEEAVKGSQDKTARPEQMAETKPDEGEDQGQNQEAENEETEGVGMAESRQASGHEGERKSSINRKTLKEEKEEEKGRGKPNKPGESDPDRALADRQLQKAMQVHTTKPDLSKEKEEKEGVENDDQAISEANLFEHIKQVDKRSEGDALAKDAATEEQAKEQLQMDKADNDDDADTDVVMEEGEEEETLHEEIDQLESEELDAAPRTKKSRSKRGEPQGMEDGQEEDIPTDHVIEGETALTLTVVRGNESTFVTRPDLLTSTAPFVSMETVEQLRNDLEQRLATWCGGNQPDDQAGQETWRQLEMVTSGLAQDLCESLRLILEPSQASRLKGDYRTGKRLNMRKVIPYIASQFRKDRIWLRRTKPAQRNYQIVLAVDDSSSMADNRSKELAFESVALISKALCLLEAGQLGVVSFGEQVQLLHPLHEAFNDTSGPRILQQFTFEQKKTRISELVDFVTAMMNQAKSTAQSQSQTAQLLLIVSDGRGLFSEGADCVHQAIRRAKQAGLFMVFVIVDNPEGKDSILDIRLPVFDPTNGQLASIKPYLDSFPFPFYVILRDIQTLPVVLSDALRQWFELVTTSSSAGSSVQ